MIVLKKQVLAAGLVTGLSYEEYVTQNIFTPLNMSRSSASLEKSKDNGLIAGYRNFFGISIAGEPDYPDKNSWSQVSAGYISSSASDMAKYLQMYLKQGEDILTPKSVNTLFYDNVYLNILPYWDYYGMGWVQGEKDGRKLLHHNGLVENYTSQMYILPEDEIGIAILVNTNDFFVTVPMMETINNSAVSILMGDNPIELNESKYLISHLLIDAVYLVIFIIGLLPMIFLKKYIMKLKYKKAGRILTSIVILHILFPTVLLLVPKFLGIPLWVVRFFVPDLFLVLITSSMLLFICGIIKVSQFYRARI